MAITISGSGITSANIADGTIVNADINSSAAIDGSKLTGAGKVLQVVHGNYNTFSTSSSTTYVDTGLSATITPSSTSSKILILVNLNGIWLYASTRYMKARILRGSTGLAEFLGGAGYVSSVGATAESSGTNQLDSPNTTSAITYKVQAHSAGSYNTSWCNNSALSSITLMEIGV